MDLFDLLLESDEPEALLAAEPDPELRAEAEHLWRHHLLAGRQNFLERPIAAGVMPVFQPGQVLVRRFEVQQPLGQGGMGEVYLAYDRILGERVALKTIARLLASSDWIRSRFVAEVKNARRVTHPNVCRIHEIFEDGEIPFFAMEYVDGMALGQLLDSGAVKRKAALTLALQLAEGLHAAHRNGVVHGDFKPPNILVAAGEPQRAVITDFGLARALNPALLPDPANEPAAAGTLDFMAPELLAGALPSIATDVFAFGKVGRLLLPGNTLWNACADTDPAARLSSLEPVIRHLKRDQTRRYWIGGAVSIAAVAILYGERRARLPRMELPEGARILVNGFRGPDSDAKLARLARGIFVTGASQSLRVHPLGDEDLLPALRRLNAGATLPISGNLLDLLAAQLRAPFWIDGEVRTSGERVYLTLRLLNTNDHQILLEQPFRDFASVLDAAAEAAQWLRRASGESVESIQFNGAYVDKFSSSIPEALSLYYDAMAYYAVADMEQALPLFRAAVQVDPNFAQARSSLASCLNSFGRFDESFPEAERAFHLSRRVPERERASVDAIYYWLADDPVQMVEAARKNLSFHPDEPRFLRTLGRHLSRTGNAAAGVPYLKQAVALQPQSALLRLDLVEVLCVAGRFVEAFRTFQQSPDLLAEVPVLHEGAAFALLGLERYREALASANRVALEMPRLPPACQIMLGDLDVAESALLGELGRLETAGTLLDRFETRIFLSGLYVVTDQPAMAANQLRETLAFPSIPVRARYLEETAFWAARIGDAALLGEIHEGIKENFERWPTGRAKSALHYVQGLIAVQALDTAAAEAELTVACGVTWALWSLFDLADVYTTAGKHVLARAYWERFEEKRGAILYEFFPGVLPLAWLRRAQAASAGGDKAEAQLLAQKVVACWGARSPNLRVVQSAQALIRN